MRIRGNFRSHGAALPPAVDAAKATIATASSLAAVATSAAAVAAPLSLHVAGRWRGANSATGVGAGVRAGAFLGF